MRAPSYSAVRFSDEQIHIESGALEADTQVDILLPRDVARVRRERASARRDGRITVEPAIIDPGIPIRGTPERDVIAGAEIDCPWRLSKCLAILRDDQVARARAWSGRESTARTCTRL